MKKIVLTILLCSLLIQLFTSCSIGGSQNNEANQYYEKKYNCEVIREEEITGNPICNVYVADIADSSTLYHITTSYDFIDHEKYDSFKPKEKYTIEFLGDQITGTFEVSRTGYIFSTYPYYAYNVKNTNIHFMINPQGELCSITYPQENPLGEELSEQEAYTQALQIAGEYVDVNNYAVSFDKTSQSIYELKLTKEIDGYNTAEQLTVLLRSDRTRISAHFQMLNEIDVNAHVSIPREDIIASVYSKVDEIICDYKDQFEKLHVSISSMLLTKLYTGKYAMICDVTLDASVTKGEYEEHTDNMISFVVELD